MTNNNTQWLKLRLRPEVSRKDAYVQIHTHLAIFSSCLEQGATIAFFEPDTYRRELPSAVFYVKTDHESYFKSCMTAYKKLFEITECDENFELPAGYELVLGEDQYQAQSLSA